MEQMEEPVDLDRDCLLDEIDAVFQPHQKEELQQKDCYTWKSSKQSVHRTFELPIPISKEGTKVKYSFGSNNYDIAFAIAFKERDSHEVRTLLDEERYMSHVEPVSGELEFSKTGTLLLQWNNKYSWFNPKELSYTVSLDVVDDDVAELMKCDRAHAALTQCALDVKESKQQLTEVIDGAKALSASVVDLRLQIEQLSSELKKRSRELEQKAQLLSQTETQANALKDKLARRRKLLPYLGIRTLPMTVMMEILSYLDHAKGDGEGGGGGGNGTPALLVCKDWYYMITSPLQAISSGGDDKSLLQRSTDANGKAN